MIYSAMAHALGVVVSATSKAAVKAYQRKAAADDIAYNFPEPECVAIVRPSKPRFPRGYGRLTRPSACVPLIGGRR